MLPILLSVLAVSADAEPPAPKEPPQVLTASVKGDKLVSKRTVTVNVPVTVIQKVKQGDKEVDVTVTRLVPEMRTVEVAMDLSRATITTAGGKKLDLDALKKRLDKPRPVVVSGDGKPVDESYLKLLDKDAIVIVVPRTESKPKRPLPPKKEEKEPSR